MDCVETPTLPQKAREGWGTLCSLSIWVGCARYGTQQLLSWVTVEGDSNHSQFSPMKPTLMDVGKC